MLTNIVNYLYGGQLNIYRVLVWSLSFNTGKGKNNNTLRVWGKKTKELPKYLYTNNYCTALRYLTHV